MPHTIAANDPHLTWMGAISIESGDDGVMPWRINDQIKTLFAEELVNRAAMPAGVRVTFMSDTSTIEGTCNSVEERSRIDLVVNGKLAGSVDTENLTTFRFENLGNKSKNIELWLPQFGEFRLGELTIDGGAKLSASAPSDEPKWITYGSSITHCRAADSPTQTWPAIVARTRGYDLTCLGYGGQCHLDPMVARTIRDREADVISLCIGINIYGGSSLNERTFGPGILGFVQIIREKHPIIPIALMSPIYFHKSEDIPNEVGFTLIRMREIIAESVEILRANGDENITYINGLDIFDSDNAPRLPDDLHPDNEGYAIMAQNILKCLPTA
jgi:lysophospholipase L1-like esterase